MTDATKKKIFEPMFTTKEVGKGMGMGLSLTAQIIKNHNGSIKVKSQLGEGCTFIIKLPVRQAKKEGHSELI
jgi:signal transduction histidine kinase